jgi:hypothetical protein
VPTSLGLSDDYYVLECDTISQNHEFVFHLLHLFLLSRIVALIPRMHSHSDNILGLNVKGVFSHFPASLRWSLLSIITHRLRSYKDDESPIL